MNLSTLNRIITLLTHIIDINSSTEPIVEFVPQKKSITVYESEKLSKKYFQRSVPEEQGISAEQILSFLIKLKNSQELNMHTLMIIRNGKVICETGFGSYDLNVPVNIYSAAKSITSLAIGMLIDEGTLSVDEKIINIFNDECSPINKLKLKDHTVRNLLTMTSGISFDEAESMTEKDWLKAILNSSVKGDNQTFSYNSINTYLLSAIVYKKSGVSLLEYLKPRLFEPLEIECYSWELSAEGFEKGGWGLYLRLEDLAKIAYMIACGGVFNGRRIISEEYLAEATKMQVETPCECGDYNYGYQLWVGRDTNSFLMNGMFGQNALYYRNNGIMILTTAGNNEVFQQSVFYKYVKEFFSGDFEERISKNSEADHRLETYIASLENRRMQSVVIKKSFFALMADSVIGRLKRKNTSRKTYSHVPDNALFLIGKSYETIETKAASVGLMPEMLQILQNNYTKGVRRISFLKDDNGIFVINYVEENEILSIPVDFALNEEFHSSDNYDALDCGHNRLGYRTELSFGGEHYLVSALGSIMINEDMKPLLKLTIDFLETPFTRVLKFIFSNNYENMTLVQSECLGIEFVHNYYERFKSSYSEKPLIATAFEKFGDDYAEYKIERVFSPQLKFNSITKERKP